MSKENNNPFADAEASIADAIRNDAVISGILGGGGKKVEVFAVTAESAKKFIERQIRGALGVCVFVNAGSVDNVVLNERASAIVNFDITVRAPDIVSEPYRTTSDIACEIIRLLHLSCWGEPFCQDSYMFFTGMNSSNDNGIVRDLSFSAKVNLIL